MKGPDGGSIRGETTNRNEEWSTEKSKELYGIGTWGGPFFDVNEKGNVLVTPSGPTGPSVDLLELTQDLQERGIRVPMLIRFPDITKTRVELM
ncbi:MAG: arginine decarboxylase, partial [Bdellovibrionaceae bacterium]|nr:arginine decarboxylase [Pseudobdellovibrionaceae bacterium]